MIKVRSTTAMTAGIALAAIGLLQMPGAFAHSQTQSTSPKANAVLKTSPSLVRVNLNEPLISSGAALIVRSSKNASVTSGKPAISGKSISIALLPNLADDTYRVSYRVVSNDGHVVTSSYKFTVKH